MPADWKKRDNIWIGPRNADGVAARIEAHCYSAVNPYYKSADDYLNHARSSVVPVAGESTGPIEALSVAGYKARRFTRDTFEVLPAESINAKSVAVREERIVLKLKSGFCVFGFTASRGQFPKRRKHFQRMLDTLRTRPPN